MRFTPNNNRFVYLNGNPRQSGGGAGAESRQSPEAQELLDDIVGATIGDQTKAYLKSWLLGGDPLNPDPARVEIVRRFLDKEIDEARFETEREAYETQQRSWNQIVTIRRGFSTRIMNTLESVESYRELVPYQKKLFDRSYSRLKKINVQDRQIEGELRGVLSDCFDPPTITVRGAGQPLPVFAIPARGSTADTTLRAHIAAVYNNRVGTNAFQTAFTALQAALPLQGISTDTPPGPIPAHQRKEATKLRDDFFRKIIIQKNKERQIELAFERTVKETDRIILDSLDKAKALQRSEVMIGLASEMCGVTLKEGTHIIARLPDPLASGADIEAQGGYRSAPRRIRITNVAHRYALITDGHGKNIGRQPEVLMITCVDEETGQEYTMPYGRFKKWLDAVDGVELTENENQLNERTNLEMHNLALKPGMELSYVRHRREKNGELTRVPTFVSVKSVGGGNVVLNEPVQYAPGFEDIDYAEMRDTLTYGEFLKWWRRYDVDATLDINALRERLKKFNDRENKLFKALPGEKKVEPLKPITLTVGEELRYPCEGGYSFRIKKIGDEGITLDNESFLTFNDFYKWVERNHVERAPDVPKSELEEQQETENKVFAKTQNDVDKKILAEREELAKGLMEKTKDYKQNKGAVDIWQQVKHKWYSTTMLSLSDLGNMTKEIKDFIVRRHERKSKGRYSQVGERLPGLIGVDFERAKEDAEHEEVGKYQHAMEHWGIDTLYHTLHTTNDKDVCKAAIIVLVGKGEMRWDDTIFWETLNRLTFKFTNKGGELHIPGPTEYGPHEHYEDFLTKAIDSLWAKRQFLDWSNENKSKYNGNVSTMQQRFKELESDPKGTGGPKAELQRLLKDYLTTDKYVNPHEYESIIDGAIENGKMSAEQKMFFLIAGVAAVPHHPGRHPHIPLLSYERVGEFNSKHLARFPMMDYFTQKEIEDPFLGLKDPDHPEKGYKTRKFKQLDFQIMVDRYFHDEVYGTDDRKDIDKFLPGPQFSRFMWEEMLTSEEVRTRISKAMRSAENIDHDDAHMFIPPTDPEEMKKLLGTSTGNKQYFTMEGYANGYPGFNQWFNVLANKTEEEQDPKERKKHVGSIQAAVNSFIIFDQVLAGNYAKEDKALARLDRQHYEKGAITDGSVPIKLHQAQLRNLVMELAKAYGYGDRFAFLYNTKLGSYSDPEERKKCDEFKAKVDNLRELITNMILDDDGAKALEVIKRLRTPDRDESDNGLRGIVSSRRPDMKTLSKNVDKGLTNVKSTIHSRLHPH